MRTHRNSNTEILEQEKPTSCVSELQFRDDKLKYQQI